MKPSSTFCLLGSSLLLTASAPPKPANLSWAGETVIFSFATKTGKTAALCRGPKGAYLVYRFGTAANVELQYPAKLDASSWQKFTYWSYQRGNPYLGIAELKFQNQGVQYTISDHTSAQYDKQHEEIYPRAVSIWVTVKGKEVSVVGNSDTAVGELDVVRNDHKVKLEKGMAEGSE
ncbi:hypothetical protein Q5H92_23550 [Hymenobacter sp. M29]|uniref:Uncharacterized protein n=1 Tax=Hymenobacter mellowenesis TaxID=3063995 RepID=A0ABT9AHK4_9BACT|nr:hypothetical protein [Hymenobacter sp. M29]MDO7849359.1 hypothetical protein [Hymenobacter sp. M29]